MRSSLILVGLAVIIVTVLVLSRDPGEQPPEPKPSPGRGPGPTRPKPVPDDNFFGVTPVMVNLSAAEWEAAYARMREGGVSWVRFNIPWHVIETSEGGTYDWTAADNRVRNATCQGLEVVPGFADTPFWASGVVNKLASPPQPQYLGSWRTFVTATIDRYGGQGSFWGSGQHCADGSPMPRSPARVYQAWNEPNVSAFWGGKTPSPSYYMRLLQATKQAALASTSPNSQIMLGGLTGDHEGGAASYLRRLYRQPISLQHNADIIDVHPYATNPNKSLALVETIRKIINRHDRSALRFG